MASDPLMLSQRLRPMRNQRLRPILSGMAMAHTTAPTMAGIGTMASAPLMLNQRLRPTLNGMAITDTTAPTMVGITTTASAPPMLSLSPRGTSVEATTADASTESALLKERERQFLRQ